MEDQRESLPSVPARQRRQVLRPGVHLVADRWDPPDDTPHEPEPMVVLGSNARLTRISGRSFGRLHQALEELAKAFGLSTQQMSDAMKIFTGDLNKGARGPHITQQSFDEITQLSAGTHDFDPVLDLRGIKPNVPVPPGLWSTKTDHTPMQDILEVKKKLQEEEPYYVKLTRPKHRR